MTAGDDAATLAADGAARDVGPIAPVPSWRGVVRAATNVGRGLLLVVAAVGLLGIRNPTSIEHYATGFLFCVAGAVATVGMRRDLAWVIVYLVAFAAFAYVRAAADETGIPTRFDYPIALERALPGPLPGHWLQEQFWKPGVSTLDHAASLVHFSYFVVPHGVALAIWKWRRPLIGRYVVAIMITLYGATLFAALVPTAPPWMAAQQGLIPPMAKVNDWVYGAMSVDGYTREIVHMNAVAAMPSLHFALTGIAVAGLWHFGPIARLTGVIYLLVMGLALVYMGEHYVADLAGGAVFAAVAWFLAPRIIRGVRDRPSRTPPTPVSRMFRRASGVADSGSDEDA